MSGNTGWGDLDPKTVRQAIREEAVEVLRDREAMTTFWSTAFDVAGQRAAEAGGGSNVHPIFDSGTSDQGGSDMSRGVIFGDMGYLGWHFDQPQAPRTRQTPPASVRAGTVPSASPAGRVLAF